MKSDSVGNGIVLTVVLHMLQVFIGPAVYFVSTWLLQSKDNQDGGNSLALVFAGFGVTQLIYMIPAILRFRKRGERRTMQGLIIGASVTFLVCAACDGSFLLPGLVSR